MKEPIRKIELKDGTVRYRLVVDIGRDEKGKRQQITRTFDKLKEARAELSRVRHETDQGTYVKPSETTVDDYLDEYLVGATRGRRESTKVSYRDAFRPVRERLGARTLQSVSKASRTSWTGCSRPAAGVVARSVPALAPDRYGSLSVGSRPRSRWQ